MGKGKKEETGICLGRGRLTGDHKHKAEVHGDMQRDLREALSPEKQTAGVRKPLKIFGTGGDSTRLENLKTHRMGTPGLRRCRCLSNTSHATNVHYDGIGLWSGKIKVGHI